MDYYSLFRFIKFDYKIKKYWRLGNKYKTIEIKEKISLRFIRLYVNRMLQY